MTTRRRLLAGLGTAALGGLAGCSALQEFRDDESDEKEEEVDRSRFDGSLPRASLPVSALPIPIPDSLIEGHRTRAVDLLDTIPADPQIPNGNVERRIESERERLHGRLDQESDATLPTERLEDWRYVRGNAADLAAQYRAATGTDDGDTVRQRRDVVRENLYGLRADLEYRAADPVEAVLVYTTVEELLDDARQDLTPDAAYPDDPVAGVQQAGDAVESVEGAAASLADARGIRDAYLTARSERSSQWATLVTASRRLGFAVDISRRPYTHDEATDPTSEFDRDVKGTVADRLFRVTARRIRPKPEDTRAHRRDGNHATAILSAGHDLTAIAVLRSVVDAIESDGTFVRSATAESIRGAAESARDAFAALADAEQTHLAAALASPAVHDYQNGLRYLAEEHFDPQDAEVEFRHAALVARAAPKAASYVVARIEESAG